MKTRLKTTRSEYIPLAILVALSLLIGLLTIHHYGESWDEYNFYTYAEESLSAYAGLFQPDYKLEIHDPTLRYYGPWLLMVIVQTSKFFPSWLISDIGHLLTFIVSQFGVVIFYFLARRWLVPSSSFGATLLFATQPLLWGHGFINSRDIPFMVGFMAIIYFGLRMSDSFSATPQPKPQNSPQIDIAPLIRADWKDVPKRVRLLLPWITIIGLILLGRLVFSLSDHWSAKGLLNADTTSARDLDLYLRPLLSTFWAAMSFFSLTILFLAGFYLPFMPALRKHLWKKELEPLVDFLKSLLQNRALLFASLALGLTVSIRIMGFAAAGLVGVLILIRHGKQRIPALLVYGLLALPIVYITWPYLWAEPILRLAITLKVMLHFPWPGQVLFNGQFYDANLLPWNYLPKLFSIQLTEPVLVLALIGFIVSSYQLLRRKVAYELLLLSALWFLLPLGAAVFSHPYLYDNFRQMLFILPPLFLLAGVGLELFLERIKKPVFQGFFLALLILPSIVVGIQLHPYEYTYYNNFAGGTQGAFRQYEMDYWGTAFRETAIYINENTEENADVVVWGPATVLWRYARPDLKIYDARQDELPEENFYAVISSRHNNDLLVYPDIEPDYILDKNGVILAVVKYVE